MVAYPEGLTLGEKVDIGAFTYINAQFHIIIGDNVQIGAHCAIYSNNTINNVQGPVEIHKGAKIGAHSVILPNVIIREDQLIKAGSVVFERDGIVYARTPTLFSFIDTILPGDRVLG
jgi:acetyltransferase-like isoleucine patch superfamily enzyme